MIGRLLLLLILLPATAKAGDRPPVATAGGIEITSAEFDRELGRLRRSGDMSQALKAMDPDRRQEVLDGYIDRKLMVLAAQKAGVARNEEVAAALADARDTILADAYHARRIESRLTPQASREFFDANPSLFALPPRVKCRHILLKTAVDAETALGRLNGGEDFCRVAEELSIDRTTGRKCGEIGWVEPGVMVKSFEDYIYGLKPGGPAGIAETQYGFHLVQVMERTERQNQGFESVMGVVKERLKQKLQDDMRRELRREYPVIKH